jgi:hypothetical protein
MIVEDFSVWKHKKYMTERIRNQVSNIPSQKVIFGWGIQGMTKQPWHTQTLAMWK